MSVNIDTLQIEIQSSSTKAATGLYSLETALKKVRAAAKGGIGLTTVAKQITALSTAMSSVSGFSEKTNTIANVLNGLGKVSPASDGLKSVITQLKKLPGVISALETTDLEKFNKQIQQLVVYLQPLATEMDKVSRGFSALPSNIQKAINANAKLTTSANAAAKSKGLLGSYISKAQAKFLKYSLVINTVKNVMKNSVYKSMEYVENLNLFTVAMGSYADQALAYAEKVQSIMGIDMSEWIRNQGVFMQIASGFGIVEDKAYTLSRGLTQVSYDIASFFNIGIEEALQKVQSGIAGELEPLRRLGYALDVATLQQVAYAHGIRQSINTMTQAQKAQIRYIAIMEQSKNVVGDMARTLGTPANAMRILSQQVTQLSRAFGNMLIPVLSAVIPYVQAVVQVLTEAFTALARLLGFKLPTIDYSNSVSSMADQVTDSVNNVGSAAGKAKKELRGLLGIDELNVLTQPTSGSGGGGGSSLGGSDLGLDLSAFDYDFLGDASSKVSEIVDAIKSGLQSIYKVIKPILPIIEGIVAAVGVTKLLKWVKGLKSAKVAMTALSGVGTAMWIMLKNGRGILSAVTQGWTQFKSNMQDLSGFQKATVTLAGLAATGVTSYSAFKQAAMGTQSLGLALGETVVVAGGFGAALTAMFPALGPGGWIIAGVTAIVAGFAGWSAGQQELLKLTEEQQAAFDADVEKTSQWIASKVTAASEITKLGESIQKNDETINESRAVIDSYMEVWKATGAVSTDSVKTVVEACSTMLTQSREKLQSMKDAILQGINGAFISAAQQAGYSADQIYGVLDIITGSVDDAYGNLQKEIEKTYALLEKETPGTAQYNELKDRLLQLVLKANDASGSLSAAEQASSQFAATLGKYDLTDVNAVKDAAGNLNQVFEESKQKVADAATQQHDYWTQIQKQYTDGILSPEDTAKINETMAKLGIDSSDAFFKAMHDSVNAWQSDANASLSSAYQQAGKDLLDKFAEGMQTAVAEGKISASDALYQVAGLRDDLTKQGFTDAGGEYGRAVVEGMAKGVSSTNTGDLGINDKLVQADKEVRAKQGINSPAKSWIPIGESIPEGIEKGVSDHKSNIADKLLEVLTAAFTAVQSRVETQSVPIGQSIVTGIGTGVTSKQSVLASAMQTLANNTYNAFVTANGGASASKYQTFGKTIVQAIANGMKNNTSLVRNAATTVVNELKNAFTSAKGASFETVGKSVVQDIGKGIANAAPSLDSAAGSMYNRILSKTDTFCDRVRNAINKLVSDMGRAFATLNVTTGGVSFTRMPNINIPRFADGGFPQKGSLFFANEEAPELVGSIGRKPAVANNDQIVSAVSQGVAQAVGQALKASETDSAPVIVVQVGEDVIARASIRGINAITRREGNSPLLNPA